MNLKVDFSELTSLGALMLRAVSAVESVKSTSNPGAHTVGSDDVAEALHDFSNNWDHERGEFTRRARKIGEMVNLAGTQYGDLERQLTTGMSDSGSA